MLIYKQVKVKSLQPLIKETLKETSVFCLSPSKILSTELILGDLIRLFIAYDFPAARRLLQL